MKVGTLIHPSWLAESLLNPRPGEFLIPHIERCVGQGASHIELTGEIFTMAPPPILEMLNQEIQHVLRPYKEEHDISFSLHLPAMGGLDLSSSIEPIRRITIETFRSLVELTSPLEPQNYVLHIAGMIQEATASRITGSVTARLRQILVNNAIQSVREMFRFLTPEALCLENLPAFPMEFLSSFVENLDLSVCLDIGHLAMRGEPLEDFLEKFQLRIREVHLHDVKKVNHDSNGATQIDHQALGEGDLNMQQIIKRLHLSGFSGPIVLETLHDREMKSIAKLKKLLQELRVTEE